MTAPAYHRQVASEKRAAILTAAMALFTEHGYRTTSLAQIASLAGVSKATLFKQFPTKDALVEAIVAQFWEAGDAEDPIVEAGDPEVGLTAIGTRYAALLSTDGMAGLTRMTIAEAPRFPELARIQFDLGKAPFFEKVRRYLEAQTEAGALSVEDSTTAATQFLGMISNYVLWPRMLLVDWSMSSAETERVVREAVLTTLARYRPDGLSRGQRTGRAP